MHFLHSAHQNSTPQETMLPADCWAAIATFLDKSLADISSLRLVSRGTEGATRHLFMDYAIQALYEDLDPSEAGEQLLASDRMSSCITHLRVIDHLWPYEESVFRHAIPRFTKLRKVTFEDPEAVYAAVGRLLPELGVLAPTLRELAFSDMVYAGRDSLPINHPSLVSLDLGLFKASTDASWLLESLAQCPHLTSLSINFKSEEPEHIQSVVKKMVDTVGDRLRTLALKFSELEFDLFPILARIPALQSLTVCNEDTLKTTDVPALGPVAITSTTLKELSLRLTKVTSLTIIAPNIHSLSLSSTMVADEAPVFQFGPNFTTFRLSNCGLPSGNILLGLLSSYPIKTFEWTSIVMFDQVTELNFQSDTLEKIVLEDPFGSLSGYSLWGCPNLTYARVPTFRFELKKPLPNLKTLLFPILPTPDIWMGNSNIINTTTFPRLFKLRFASVGRSLRDIASLESLEVPLKSILQVHSSIHGAGPLVQRLKNLIVIDSRIRFFRLRLAPDTVGAGVESVSLEPASSLSGETVTVELPDLLHLSIRTWSIENLDLTCPNLRSLHVSYVNYVDVQTIIDNHSLLENITIQSVGTDSELTFNLDKLRCIRLRYLVNLERCEVVTPSLQVLVIRSCFRLASLKLASSAYLALNAITGASDDLVVST